MGVEDAARARVRAEMRGGWSLGSQREYAERELEAARVRLAAVLFIIEEVAASERHSVAHEDSATKGTR